MALSFGVEIELLVCPRGTPSLSPLAPASASSLQTMRPSKHEPKTDNMPEIPRYWRVELVSRVLSTTTDWQNELQAVFEVLHDECKVRLTTGCSMHVHVSPYDGRYTAGQLQKICKALCYFDNAITKVMPAERKDNPWATSNKLKRAYTLVPAHSWAYIFKLLDKTTPKHVHGMLSGGWRWRSRYCSWNFENVTEACGTIEFRRPPGADSPDSSIHWAAFTLGFVARALATDWAPYASLKTVGSVADLERFILGGISTLGPTMNGALGWRIVEDTSPPTVLTAEELGAIERKKKNKDRVKSPFVEKVSGKCWARIWQGR
ncbi:putative amidoligase enzyme-domain-containing protein [Corynascus novoguineensis]|uniref:Amidoligase enzyme-domain-containing protein n=1 Tax=Corynascus novoguineensis TaxID=1126955 RepID=A0AAN7D2T1_9PEZI|nr:putative amidoligase enzyme-domain-containing protein [Corynascus novoguineensis]